jgi:hypothetical protein
MKPPNFYGAAFVVFCAISIAMSMAGDSDASGVFLIVAWISIVAKDILKALGK